MQLTVTAVQYYMLLERKTAIESKFAVQLNTPAGEDFSNKCFDVSSHLSVVSESISDCGYFLCSVTGKSVDVAAAKKYIMEALLQPEIIEICSYPKGLEEIFSCGFWKGVIERINNVCVSKGADHELSVAGTESSVACAVSKLQKLCDIYESCSKRPTFNKELAQELSKVLKTLDKDYEDFTIFCNFPEGVNELFLSWLKEAYQEHFLNSSMSEDLDSSVVVLNNPIPDAKVCIITIDSSDDENISQDTSQGSDTLSKKQLQIKKIKRTRKFKRAKVSKCLKKKEINFPNHDDLNRVVPGATTSYTKFQAENRKMQSSNSLSNLPDFVPLFTSNTEITFPRSKNSKLKKKERKPNSCSKLPDFIPTNTKTRKKPSTAVVTSNIAPSIPETPKELRPIVIDGSNVAMAHGNNKIFSCRGIALSIEYFQKRGHTSITALVPQHRRHCHPNFIVDKHVLEELAEKQLVVFTPSKRGVDGVRITCYDDRFIIDLANRTGGVVVSNDAYLDLIQENAEWTKVIKERVLMFCFVGDILMFPEDPLGANGPLLKDFLCFPNE